MPEETDIYTLDATPIIIRISADDSNDFNQQNEFSIDQLKRELEDKEIECLFQKIANEDHKIFVPILSGQLEVCTKLHSSETYQAVVNKKLKTVFRKETKFPERDYHKEIVSIRIIDVNEKGRATDEFVALFKKVENLPISSTINIENQQEIWFKWIEAQKAIIDNLQKPYEVKGNYTLQETKNNDGEVTRYTLKFDLANEILPEYRLLESKLKELGIDVKFDSEGNVFLTKEQIALLDTVIQKEFSDKVERSQTIGVILKLRPFTLAQKILREIGVFDAQVEGKQLLLMGKSSNEIKQRLREKGFEFRGYKASFKIINHGNIIEDERFSIDIESKFPYPKENTFIVYSKNLNLPRLVNDDNIFYDPEYLKLHFFYIRLMHIYGNENIVSLIESVFEIINPHKTAKLFDEDFTEDFWVKLKRKLYVHNLEDAINSFNQSLYLEYNNEEELQTQLKLIEDLQVCNIAYSPSQPDFRFKVKTNVIAKKSKKELFLEKIKLLRGGEFVVEVVKEGSKRNELIYLGKLNGNESNIQQLVLNIPLKWDFKRKKYFVDKQTKAGLEFLKANPIIKGIRANLTGDATKIGWLQNAIKKITEPTDAPNGKAANERLGGFIFDTSKATPIYDEAKVAENSEHYWVVRNNELLKLNEAQRKAVLASIHCQDLALLQGPPGTGKTTVIAEIIWQLISKNPKHRILLTSETNLAVDNALDRLLNTKGVNPNLARYTTLIKPLRFGRMGKMDEEGAKYSIDRIMKWLDETYQIPQEYEPETLDEQDDEFDDDVQKNSPENNAVQDWMKRIASRAKNNNPKYANALKDWALDLSFPTQETKQIFKDKYFEYANVVGSTCSSSGSPRFMWDLAKVFSGEDLETLKSLCFLATVAPMSNRFLEQIQNIVLPEELNDEFQAKLDNYKEDYEDLKEELRDEEGRFDRDELRQEAETLNSYSELIEFTKKRLTPFFEPQVQFDTVIMDEASKATPPELVLPLCFAKQCLVIGDHRQLPPMLNEKDFREALQEAGAGYLADEIDREFTETSQFERMILNPKVSPTIISRCNIQYRMHPDINNVIKQFYLDEGGLEPAQELIENADDIDLGNVFSKHHGLYFPDFIDANTHTIWVNVKTPEMREGTSVTNEGEVKAIRMVIEMLKKAEGFEAFQKHWDFIKDDFKRKQEKEIGIISFYGAQKRLIKRSLAGIGVPVKINTVDRFQGMERNIVIVSTVRSNIQTVFGGKTKPNTDSGFAKSPQRLNVALSRGKRLLIVVGNKDFFEQVTDKTGRPLYKNAIAEIVKSGKIIDFETLQNQLKK